MTTISSPPNAADEEQVPLVPLLDPHHGGQLRSVVRTVTLLLTTYGALLFHLDAHTLSIILTSLAAADLVVTGLTYRTSIGNATPVEEDVEEHPEWNEITDQLVLSLWNSPSVNGAYKQTDTMLPYSPELDRDQPNPAAYPKLFG